MLSLFVFSKWIYFTFEQRRWTLLHSYNVTIPWITYELCNHTVSNGYLVKRVLSIFHLIIPPCTDEELDYFK